MTFSLMIFNTVSVAELQQGSHGNNELPGTQPRTALRAPHIFFQLIFTTLCETSNYIPKKN